VNQESQLGNSGRWDRRGRRSALLITPNPKLKLLDQVREVMRLKHYSIHTERSYSDWVRRYVKFHRMRQREELVPGSVKVELFLSDLAVNGRVAASTQNQAFNALLFLIYTHVLRQGGCGMKSPLDCL
jgi:Phage integrase, N-terminal SAM-like domain